MDNPGPSMPWRAKNAIDRWMLAVELQHQRANEPITDAMVDADGESVSEGLLKYHSYARTVDIELYLVALRRLRRAAEFAMNCVPAGAALRPALEEFDDSVPKSKILRDVTEHFDSYEAGKGWERQPGEVGFVTTYTLGRTVDDVPVDGAGFTWGDRSVDSGEATQAARRLHGQVRAFLQPLL